MLGLAYAQAHPRSVSELVLFSIVEGTQREVDWATRRAGRFYPEEWQRFQAGVPRVRASGDLRPPTTGCCSIPTQPFTSRRRRTGATGMTDKCVARPAALPALRGPGVQVVLGATGHPLLEPRPFHGGWGLARMRAVCVGSRGILIRGHS